MKTLELKLKKDVFIVDAISQYIANGIIFQKFGVKTLSEFEFICKGSELTEEIASELVETYEINFYVDYNSPNHYGYCFTSLESFISAVESKSFHWLENPIEKPINYELWAKYGDYTQYGIVLTEKCLKWQEAEEKTFKNPLIFVKK